MRFESFDGNEFKKMLVGSANRLAEARDDINALNVFPVPDGDTGTNMYLTLLAGVKETSNIQSGSVGDVAAAAARGCLLGARGNSGVILSQFMQGFASAVEGIDRVDPYDVARAFTAGADFAYKAVINPVEGTILTVARRSAESFQTSVERGADLLKAMVYTYKQSRQALDASPELLSVLKEAGVVDAGGKGLVLILEGIIYALKMAAGRQEIELFDLASSQHREFVDSNAANFDAVIEFTYCTELIIRGSGLPLERLRSELSPYGDCLMVVGEGDAAKVHIHSNHPGLVLECCLKYGALHNVQIHNMEEQHKEFRQPVQPPRPLGVVAVGYGEGLVKIMESLGVDVVVGGGQTMNPSTEHLLQAINQVNAEKIFVLPNNKNIVMAAEQAASLSEKEVRVIPSHAIPQGLAAMMAFDPHDDFGENELRMRDALKSVQSGEMTRAVRDTTVKGINICSGDYIALHEEEIISTGAELNDVVQELIRAMLTGGAGLVTLYYGEEIKEQDAQYIIGKLSETYPDTDFELHNGGQPLYHFIVSAE